MKKLMYAAVGLAFIFASSCKKDIADSDEKPLLIGPLIDTLVGEITVNTTLTKDTYLWGIVFVKPGVTLTVNPGVTIRGSFGPSFPNLVILQANKGCLIVERGATLIAEGTPTQPIVWTSSGIPGFRLFGEWGGLIILGNGPITTSAGLPTNLFPAFPPDPRLEYGGPNPLDNSGRITYNRYEFAGGIDLGPNQQTNGLSLAGVGSGTVVNHIEVIESGDDAFQFFGGTVNASHLISLSNKDDDFDFDEAYTGRLQFIFAYRTDLADVSGSHMIESDNNSAAVDFGPNTRPFITNATLIGPTSLLTRFGVGFFDAAIYVRRESRIILANSLIAGQALTSVLASTPTTCSNFTFPLLNPDASPVVNTVFQFTTPTPVVRDIDEFNPISLLPPCTGVIDILISPARANGVVSNYADFMFGGVFEPTPGSPGSSGGLDLSFYGFVPTNQRGAVVLDDPTVYLGEPFGTPWTLQPWISTMTT